MSRPPYASLPEAVQQWVGEVLASPVVGSSSESGGFSPGVAARVACSSGRRAFVKAVSGLVNPDSPDLHRREARVAGGLPASVGSPALLGSYDDGTWVALVFEEVDGRPPAQPWVRSELDAVLRLLDRLAVELTPSPLDVGQLVDERAFAWTGWQMLAASDVPLSPVEAAHLDQLVTLERSWASAALGETLLHNDVRADNVLITPAGDAVLVDWPWARRGAAAVDVVMFAPTVELGGGPPAEEVVRACAVGRAAAPEAVDAMVAAYTGLMQHRMRQPPPPGIPTVREFQARQGQVGLRWLAERLAWG
ncbi:MAG: phosphotransferase [Actinobacteria bacterium]|nr:phosphotransferase [Actinomycetota bacterium]MCA1721778.1 phosphotransferase [Actinomycetota bacterium]